VGEDIFILFILLEREIEIEIGIEIGIEIA
jgi:hypothetical protein